VSNQIHGGVGTVFHTIGQLSGFSLTLPGKKKKKKEQTTHASDIQQIMDLYFFPSSTPPLCSSVLHTASGSYDDRDNTRDSGCRSLQGTGVRVCV